MKKITKENYHLQTFATWEKVPLSRIEGLKGNYISFKKKFEGVDDSRAQDRREIWTTTNELSSKYFYTKKGVYRLSQHWGVVGSCFWILKNKEFFGDAKISEYLDFYEQNNLINSQKFLLGFCKWEDFHKIKEIKTDELTFNQTYLAFEFRKIFITCKKRTSTPIYQHPNHKCSTVMGVLDFNFLTL